ncbi:hypothetical protein BBO99_00006150 [Phytophthora kernoviae]|uniref:Uncharacterized protein n=2 Tax=Phytophthora kernoviae TaxID=325452 RepID=A0A3R7J0W5_9STRA|nr:hypothetical protein G195_006967 [Phytophthora kernoviae 00238/432]KAG2522085.1 hypothetical protein JM16_006002 [Phytophthora kernoviae]KAG2523704.1 hypothetical protein JM18_005685 [Phytophthora kernoviae]RLN02720.1 hypothetical protein BBI17_006266 [Phytophthora kernoviae]RLN78183.1 hypothetical protein BBO99_00006150 [Phytophthora kernoviae]
MYGGGPPRDDMAQLRQTLEKLQHEKGEADGLLQILNAKLQDSNEENFDLRAEMLTFQAETRYQSEQNEKTLKAKVLSLESQLAFQRAQLQNAERVKLRALKEADDLQQKQEKQLLDRKKLDAEKRLLATKRRKQESFLAASQSMMSQSMLSQQQQQQVVRPVAVPVTETAVQTELVIEEKENDSHSKLKEVLGKTLEILIAVPPIGY